jgi:TIR domain
MGARPLPGRPGTAEVFISYSRRLAGNRPGPGSRRGAIRHWRSRTAALDLIGALEKAVAAAGYQAWRDRPSLRPGDPFARKIDAALLSCAAAVIVIDRDALEHSSWVRWESAILSWRGRIRMPVRVVPVFIGVRPEDLRKHGYEPSRLDQTLAYAIDPAGLDPDSPTYKDDVERHAQEIVAALGALEAEPEGPIKAWINRVAACLPTNWELWLAHVEQVIPRGQRLRLSDKPASIVARELLVAERDSFMQIMSAFYGFPFNDSSILKFNLEPVWVPADAATKIAEAKDRQPGSRIIAVNATEPRTGADVVRRALPQVTNYQRLQCSIAAVSVEEAVREAMTAIREKWPDGGSRAEQIGGCFVMISCGDSPAADLLDIVTSLASAYPRLTYVVMIGDAGPVSYEGLDPGLPQDADEEARSFDAMLHELILFGRS